MLVRIAAAAVLLSSLGCNPNGTCITASEVSDTCALSYPKRACEDFHGTFTAETREQGLLRCKELGFSSARDGTQPNYLHRDRMRGAR